MGAKRTGLGTECGYSTGVCTADESTRRTTRPPGRCGGPFRRTWLHFISAKEAVFASEKGACAFE